MKRTQLSDRIEYLEHLIVEIVRNVDLNQYQGFPHSIILAVGRIYDDAPDSWLETEDLEWLNQALDESSSSQT